MMRCLACFIAAALLAPLAPVFGQPASAPARLDPARPPQAVLDAARAERRSAQSAAARGVDAEAEAHLRASFDAADRAHRGLLTRDQARAGGFGWIANHFEAIDTRHAGEVSFDDVKRYLQATKAARSR
jgi:hypothetical protein